MFNKLISFLTEEMDLKLDMRFEAWNFTDSFSNKIREDYIITSGASKAVLIPKEDKEFVIKIPFNGTYNASEYTIEDYDLENEEDIKEINSMVSDGYRLYNFYEFEYAPYTEGSWDYCDSEVKYYDMAIKWNIEDFFSKVRKIGEINGYPIYLQEYNKYDVESPQVNFDFEPELSIIEKYYDEFYSTSWVYNFIKCWGLRAIERLSDFLYEYGISDLHEGNLGYDKENRPVIVDYAGYYE